MSWAAFKNPWKTCQLLWEMCIGTRNGESRWDNPLVPLAKCRIVGCKGISVALVNDNIDSSPFNYGLVFSEN